MGSVSTCRQTIGERTMVRNWYKKNCHSKVLSPFVKLGKALNRYYENFNYEYASNGEEHVLKVLSEFNPTVIFDVGAYQGTWADVALKNCPTAKVYSFEPVPWAFQKLSEVKHDRLKVFPFGLGNKMGSRRFVAYEGDASHLSGFYNYPHSVAESQIEISVRTGEDFVSEHSVCPDFVKIDTEGSEFEVLLGFENQLKKGAIRLIQFEYGQVNILSHYLLRDYYQYLESLDYVVGKVYPRYVDFSPYSFELENFIGSNFVAVTKKDDALFRALRK